MDPKELTANPFIGKTARTPRPSPETYKGTHEGLVRDQERWDAATAQADDNARRRADHIASVEAEREQRRTERADQERTRALAAIKARYLAQPGITEADWEAEDHDALLREQARRYALAGESTELDRMRRSGAYAL